MKRFAFLYFLLLTNPVVYGQTTIFYDDFQDPGSFPQYQTFGLGGTGEFSITDGRFHLGSRTPALGRFIAAPLGFSGSSLDVTASLTIAEDSTAGGVLLRVNPATFDSYVFEFAQIHSEEGNAVAGAVILRSDRGVITPLGFAPIPEYQFGQEWHLRALARGEDLSLWAWPLGQDQPNEPLLALEDPTYASGGVMMLSATNEAFPRPTLNQVTFNYLSVASSDTSLGDLNRDGILGVDDLESLQSEVHRRSSNPVFDLNDDQSVDVQDVRFWVKDLRETYFGDADLNGAFNSSDFVSVFEAGLYESNRDATWSTGDWSTDGVFNSTDFVVAFADGGYELAAVPIAVPEPVFATPAFLLLAFWRRRSLREQLPRKCRTLVQAESRSTVAEGTAFAGGAPRRSVRAALPHTAPTLGGWREIGRVGKGAEFVGVVLFQVAFARFSAATREKGIK